MSTEAQTMMYLYQHYLSCFIGLTFRLTHPGRRYLDAWYIELLADTLQRCYTREIRRLVINMPPRYLKSMSVSVAFPAWILGNDPTANIMCVAGQRSLAEEHHGLTRDVMEHMKYRAIFPHVDVQEKGHELRLAHGGTRRAFTPREGMTGHGADFIIIDDPLPANMAENDKAREQVNQWYDESVYQRLDDKENGVIIVVMQRLHTDDLCSHVFKQKGWAFLNLKAIAENDETYPWLYENRILRAKGEALNPALETREQLREAMLNIGPKTFMAQYQQKPYPPGEGVVHIGGLSAEEARSVGMNIRNGFMVLGTIREEGFVLRDVFGEKGWQGDPDGPEAMPLR